MERFHDDETGNGQLLNRRSLLKLGSTAVTGAGVGAFSMGTAAAETNEPASGTDLRDTLSNVGDGDTVRLEPGGNYTITGDVTVSADDWTLVGNGATVTGSGSYNTIKLTGNRYDVGRFYVDGPNDWSLRFILDGGNWDLHNIAYLNRFGSDAHDLVTPRNAIDGTTSTMRDIWFGAGLANGNRAGYLKAHPVGTVGDIEVRGCYFFQSGCYATNSSSGAQYQLDGTIDFYDCYFDSCWHDFVRTGSHNAGPTRVENCVMVTDPTKLPDGRTRGVWAWYGTTEIVDTHISLPDDQEVLAVYEDEDGYIVMNGGALDGKIYDSSADYELNDVGDTPKTSPPQGCITSPTEAVEGTDLSASTGTATNVTADSATLSGTVSGLSDGFEANVAIQYRSEGASSWSKTGTKTVSPSTSFEIDVSGLSTGVDYEFRAIATTSGGLSATGRTKTFTSFSENASTLEIRGTGTKTNYEFSVSGDLSGDGDLEEWDGVSGTTANGWVTTTQQADTFKFTGSVSSFEFLEGTAEVYVDGEQVDPSSLSAKTLRVEGTGTKTNYEFSVSGDLSGDGDLEEWDDVSGTTANGWVTTTQQVDTYLFTGEITEFSFLEGSANVYRDGETLNL
jgi:hypothetical protein